MNSLLLAAGEGRRLRPLTLTTPKCLAPIFGTPLLEVWLKLLKSGPRIEKCWINTSYLAKVVESFIVSKAGEYSPLEFELFYEEKLLGTAGTLRALMPKLADQDLLLVHADNLSWFNLHEFVIAHERRPHGTDLTMMTFLTDTPQSCGIVGLDRNDVLVEFHEKVQCPPCNLANGAVYLISPKGLKLIASIEEATDFSVDVIPRLMGRIYCWRNEVYHRDIGTPDSYEAALKEFGEVSDRYKIMST